MPNIPDGAIGAIAASLVAGLISLLGLIVSKEQKTSEFRQAWIDALRAELAAVIAHTNAICGANAANFALLSDLWTAVREDYVCLNEATAKIRLRLNPREVKANAVLERIGELELHLTPGRTIDTSAINQLEKQMVAEAQVLLKAEWRRVQTGESVYKAARFAASAFSIACIVALIGVAGVSVAKW